MNPRPQAPEGEASNQGPVDWQARSQGLEEARREVRFVADELPKLPTEDVEMREALIISLRIARKALSLGLPDEEGECHEDIGSDPCCKPTVGERLDPTHGGAYPVCAEHLRPPFPDSAYGAAPPPRGPVVQGADVFDSLGDVVVGQEPGRLLAALGRAVAAVESDADLEALPGLRGHLRRELANVLHAAEYVSVQLDGITVSLKDGSVDDPHERAEIIRHMELARAEIKAAGPEAVRPISKDVQQSVRDVTGEGER